MTEREMSAKDNEQAMENTLDQTGPTFEREITEFGANSTTRSNMEVTSGIGDAKYQIEWERRLLMQERELLEREKELLAREIKSRNKFNPGKLNSSTATQWIRTVENLTQIFKWDDRTLLFNAIAKLSGAAKMWFEGGKEGIIDWNTFKERLILDFPTAVDDADIHFELSKCKKRVDESYEHYVYSMKAITSKGNLSEKAIIKYIVAGMNDKDLSKMLAMSGPCDVQDLLTKIKNYESTMQNVHTKPHAYTKSVTNLPDNKKTENDKKCYNCNEYGHISLKCPKPQRKAVTNTDTFP
ncbi:Zinc knuckle [Popillia japonica]|uniref:Zinc knuckle n=1 Tax=Popillia japonica TaxID=7064 RepID=A0AAW1JFJ5_POPJA